MTKAKSTRGYRTVGAISGHFLSKKERAENAQLEELSVGAQAERAESAANAEPTPAYLGKCAKCDNHVYARGNVRSISDCTRCESNAADPDHWYIGEDGTWWAV